MPPASTTAREMHWSEEDYLAMESSSPIKHEFFAGEVFALAGARPEHNVIASAVLIALGVLLRGRDCRAFHSDQRIYVAETGLYTYADGGAACGRWQIHTDGMSLIDPVILFEVLSPSTRDYDRGAKLEHYQQIPSLRHVLIVDPARREVDHHRREDDGAWRTFTLRDGRIDLVDLGGEIALDDVFLPALDA